MQDPRFAIPPQAATVYISGPMRGIPDDNTPAFMEAAALFRRKGWNVINPAELDAEIGPNGKKIFDYDATVRRDSECILSLSRTRGDAIAVLPRWESSIGATAEVFLARFKSLLILDARDGHLLPPGGWYPGLAVSLNNYLLYQQANRRCS
jgi:hypothetical protein